MLKRVVLCLVLLAAVLVGVRVAAPRALGIWANCTKGESERGARGGDGG